MTIHFKTNLDEAERYVWRLAETWRGALPSVGHEIRFKVERERPRYFHLRVCSVTWSEEGVPTVELHLPTAPHRSIAEWSEWFRRMERE